MTDKKKKLVALYGKSGAGKNKIKYTLELMDSKAIFHSAVFCTTRPRRELEVQGVDYHFVDSDEFDKLSFLTQSEFNGWKYGLEETELTSSPMKINIGVFDLKTLEEINKMPNIKVFPIEVCASNQIRIIRSVMRERNPRYEEIFRRFLADEEDYKAKNNFNSEKFYNDGITVNLDNVQSLYKKILYHDWA